MAVLTSLCLRAVLFRALEGTYYTTLLPLIFQEDKFLYYNRAICSLLVA